MGTDQAEGGAPARCRVSMRSTETLECGRQVYDDEGLCICHSRKPGKDAQAFYDASQAVLASTGYIDFSHFVFPDDVSFDDTVFTRHALFVDTVSRVKYGKQSNWDRRVADA